MYIPLAYLCSTQSYSIWNLMQLTCFDWICKKSLIGKSYWIKFDQWLPTDLAEALGTYDCLMWGYSPCGRSFCHIWLWVTMLLAFCIISFVAIWSIYTCFIANGSYLYGCVMCFSFMHLMFLSGFCNPCYVLTCMHNLTITHKGYGAWMHGKTEIWSFVQANIQDNYWHSLHGYCV